MQLPYNSPGGDLVHVLFSQRVYFPISGPGRPSGKPRYTTAVVTVVAVHKAWYRVHAFSL